jgi:hypothetical protein
MVMVIEVYYPQDVILQLPSSANMSSYFASYFKDQRMIVEHSAIVPAFFMDSA